MSDDEQQHASGDEQVSVYAATSGRKEDEPRAPASAER
jgi:hypothetical protein